MNRPLFPTTLSIPSYDIGKLVGLRTCQHPLVEVLQIQRSGVCLASYKNSTNTAVMAKHKYKLSLHTDVGRPRIMEQLISLCQKKEHVCLSVDGHVPFYKQGTSMKLFCQALQPTQWPALICELDPQVAFVSALLPRGNQGFLVSVTGVTVIHFT